MIEDQKESRKKKRLGCLAVIIIGIAIGLVFMLWLGGSESNTVKDSELTAISFAEIYITDNVYSDAEFKYSDQSAVKNGSEWMVEGKFSHAGEVLFYSVTIGIVDAEHYTVRDFSIS